MEQSFIVVGLIVLLVVALLVWYVTRLSVKNKMVPRLQFEELQNSFYAVKENAGALDARLQQAIDLLQKAEAEIGWQKQKLDQKAMEFIQLNNDHVRRKSAVENLTQTKDEIALQLLQATEHQKQLQGDIQQHLQQAAHWKSQFEALQLNMKEQQKTLEEWSGKMRNEFTLLADAVLSNKAQQFNHQQETKLNDLLNPLRQNLDAFKKEITDGLKDERTHRTGLQAEVKLMADLNKKLSEQADGLTRALSSNVKQQGNWGEVILETILQYVGLQRDVHYFLQHTTANADGATIRPDCIVRYPDNRYVVIDSKVSLLHYKQWVEDDDVHSAAGPLMIQSMRRHIDGLAGKRYDTVSGVLDYVFMFIPVEGAFITSLQLDPQLWQYAFDRKILLVSPTLLVSGIKLIHELWRQDNVNRNAEAIAEKAGALYDKFHGFVKSFEDVGRKIEQAHNSFATADNQLRSGKGNLLKRAGDIKNLGAKASKILSDTGQHMHDEVDAEE